MFIRFFLVLILGFCFSPNVFGEEDQNFIGMAYHDVRPFILKAGWKISSDFREKDHSYDEELGNYYPHPFEEYGYDEFGTCTGMGFRLCDFYFKNEKNDEYLRVITRGEDNGPDSNMQTRVEYIGVTTKEKERLKMESGKNHWDEIMDDHAREHWQKVRAHLKEILEDSRR
jgi:hypothetical protein